MVFDMSYVIVVTPAEQAFRDAARLDDLPVHVRADLEGLRDEVCARFPEAEAIGETGALTRRPSIEGVGVVICPGVITRPLVVNAVMRYAAPRQLLVTAPELGLVADPRVRIDLDVHRRPTCAGVGIGDHAVRGRPHGTLPWVTGELLGQLVDKLEVDGDRLELEVDGDRWFRYERVGASLLVQVADGPGEPALETELPLDRAGTTAAAGWAWARGESDWSGILGADPVPAPGEIDPVAPSASGSAVPSGAEMSVGGAAAA